MKDEERLFADLRAKPTDAATREVYADCLEQSGDVERAQFVRSANNSAGDAEWRRAISCAAIEGCAYTHRCPEKWSALSAMESPETRRCTSCNRNVAYCISVEDAKWSGGGPFVIDPAIRGLQRGSYVDLSADIDIRPFIARTRINLAAGYIGGAQSPRRTLRQRLGEWLTGRRSR